MSAECFVYHLFTLTDDYGRFESGRGLAASAFPLRREITPEDVEGWLGEMEISNGDDLEMIARYRVDGREYGVFLRWFRNQKLRAKMSKFPAPPPEIAARCSPPPAESGGSHARADMCERVSTHDPRARARSETETETETETLPPKPPGGGVVGEVPDFPLVEHGLVADLEAIWKAEVAPHNPGWTREATTAFRRRVLAMRAGRPNNPPDCTIRHAFRAYLRERNPHGSHKGKPLTTFTKRLEAYTSQRVWEEHDRCDEKCEEEE